MSCSGPNMCLGYFASWLARKVSNANLTLFHLKNLAFPVSVLFPLCHLLCDE